MSQFCRRFGLVCLTVLMLAGIVSVDDSFAQNAEQETAGEDSAEYIVQAGDSLWGIAARNGLTLNDFLALNRLTKESIIIPGQRVLLRALPTATPLPAPTATPLIEATITPTTIAQPISAPVKSSGAICIIAFLDDAQTLKLSENTNEQAQFAFTLWREDVVLEQQDVANDEDLHCFAPLASGTYTLRRNVLATGGSREWQITLADDGSMTIDKAVIIATPVAQSPVSQMQPTAVQQSKLRSNQNAGLWILVTAIILAVGLLWIGHKSETRMFRYVPRN